MPLGGQKLDAVTTSTYHRLNVRPTGYAFALLTVSPMVGLPHLPVRMSNVTAGADLDRAARDFNAVVMYGACVRDGKPGLFRIDIYELSGS